MIGQIFFFMAFVLMATPAGANDAAMQSVTVQKSAAPSSAPAAGEENTAPVPQSHVVTSVSACAKQLKPEAAQKLRQSLKPYEDCHRLLAAQLAAEDKTEKTEAAAKKRAAETPVTPRNYIRVKKDPVPDTPENTAATTIAAPATSPAAP